MGYPPPGGVMLPGYPPPPPPPPRRRRNIGAMVWGATSIAIVVGVLVFALVSYLNSTSGVRVIVPAPATAGGLHQDYTDEQSDQFQSAVSALREHFATALKGGTFAAAIYTNAPAGESAQNATLVLVYLGFNAPTSDSPADAVKAILAGLGARLKHVTTVPEGGGAGDTRFGCETGTYVNPVVVCGWGTDRTAGLIVPQTPGTGPAQLAALMKKMEPTLVHG
jgi:hypothetical protein